MTDHKQSGSAANYGRPLIQTSRIGADQRSDSRPLIQTSRIEETAPGYLAMEIAAALRCTADWPDPETQAQLQQGRRLPPRFRWDAGTRVDSYGTEVRYG